MEENRRLKANNESQGREITKLNDQMRQMTDPTLKRFERDALVQTHQKRIRELEQYVQKMELKVNEVQG